MINTNFIELEQSLEGQFSKVFKEVFQKYLKHFGINNNKFTEVKLSESISNSLALKDQTLYLNSTYANNGILSLIIFTHDLHHAFRQDIWEYNGILDIRGYYGEQYLTQFDLITDLDIFNFFNLQYGLTFEYYIDKINISLGNLLQTEKNRPGKFERYISSIYSIYISQLEKKDIIYNFAVKAVDKKLIYLKSQADVQLSFGYIPITFDWLQKALTVYGGNRTYKEVVDLIQELKNSDV